MNLLYRLGFHKLRYTQFGYARECVRCSKKQSLTDIMRGYR